MRFDNPVALRVGPYHDQKEEHRRQVTFQTEEGPRTFTVLMSTAFNAYGLIGSEVNGVVVLDDDRRHVLCDQMDRAPSGWDGPTPGQLVTFNTLTNPDNWERFREMIDNHPRRRYALGPDGEENDE